MFVMIVIVMKQHFLLQSMLLVRMVFRHFCFVVVTVIVTVCPVFVVVARSILHTFHMGFVQQFHAVHHSHHITLQINGRQNRLYPGIRLTTQIDEQIALLHRQNIRRSRFIGMALCAGGQQQCHIDQIAAGSPGQIIGREHGDHNIKSILCRSFRLNMCRPTADQQQCRSQNQGDKTLSHKFSLII